MSRIRMIVLLSIIVFLCVALLFFVGYLQHRSFIKNKYGFNEKLICKIAYDSIMDSDIKNAARQSTNSKTGFPYFYMVINPLEIRKIFLKSDAELILRQANGRGLILVYKATISPETDSNEKLYHDIDLHPGNNNIRMVGLCLNKQNDDAFYVYSYNSNCSFMR